MSTRSGYPKVLMVIVVSALLLCVLLTLPLAAADAWQVQSSPVRATVFAEHLERAPKIDGDLRDWPEAAVAIRLDSAHLNEHIYYNPTVAGGDADCSGAVALSWDDEFLYVAARVRDDELSALAGREYGRPWEHDGLMLYLHAHSGLQLTGRYGPEYRRDPMDRFVLLGLNYYEPGAQPRTLPGRSHYVVKTLPDGYVLEAAVEWKSLGYQEVRPGDRLKMAMILVDVDPGAPPGEGFGQIIWHLDRGGMPEFSGWADLRLVREGWGGDLVALAEVGGGRVGVKATLDAVRPGVAFHGVRLRDASGEVLASLLHPQPTPVRQGERLIASAALDTQDLPAGPYQVQLVTLVNGQERNGEVSFPIALRKSPPDSDLPRVLAVDDPSRFQKRPLPPSLARNVNKQVYLDFLQEHGGDNLARLMAAGNYTRPWRYAHPSGFLAAYLASVTGEEFYAECARAALESAMQWAETQDASFDPHAGYHYLMVRHMREAGLIPEELEPRVREFLVKSSRFACVGAYAWEAQPWRRGAGHSSLGPAVARFYALHAYPDSLVPEERDTFQRYYELTWNDWWEHRDTIYNDTSYRALHLWDIFVTAYLTGRDDMFADPEARKLWERLLYTASPAGAYPHYGNTNGWSTAIGMYIFFFEYLGAELQDGRFRTAAHRLFDYLVNHSVNVRDYHFEADANIYGVALAHMVADDSVAPVPLGAESRVLTRKEVLPLDDLQLEFGHNVYGMEVGPSDIPDKIIFTTDDRPESLWAMVDLCPEAGHHTPAAPGNIIALMDYKAVLTCDQGYFDKTPDFHNVVFVEDLEGTAAATQPMEISLPEFYDRQQASYARIHTANYHGWPLHTDRRLLFARGRFLLVKDTLEFTAPWMCRVGPAWQTQRISPDLGDHWANTHVDSLYITGLGTGGGFHRWINPAQDLLIYHPPQDDCYLEVVNRFQEQPWRQLPVRMRYVWKGLAQPGEVRHFTTLLLPALPTPSPGQTAEKIQVLADTPQVTALFLETRENREEWVLLNDSAEPFEGGGLETDARQLYLFVDTGRQPASYVLAEGASYVRLRGEDLDLQAVEGRIEGKF